MRNVAEGMDLTSLCMQARGFVQQGHMKEALGLYGQILSADPRFALAYADRATAFAMMKQFPAAIEDLERAFALGYSEPSAYCTAGTICLQTQQYEQGLDHYAKAIELNPDYPFTYFNRANLYLAIGVREKAVTDLETCLRFGGAEDFRQLVMKRLSALQAA